MDQLMSYTIRDLKTYQEMVAVHRVQQEIWRLDDPTMGLHPPVLNTAARNGGVVLGAFDDATGQMVGFLFSFLGREPGGPLKLCSQAMGLLPAWRGQGLGEALKRVQRERTLAQDLPLITWTFDPLEAPNASLNLHKLRAIIRTYRRDVYGSDFGALNAGLPSDRLVAEWWIKGPRVDRDAAEEAGEWSEATPIFEVEGQGLSRRVVRANLALDDDLLHLEIPADIHPLKASNLELAMAWRTYVRQALERYFDQGYLITDFISTFEHDQRRNRYILRKATPELLADIGLETG
jgi:predicted GNAT superfamily acetyltransferase